MFYQCSKLKEIIGIETWDTSQVSDVGSLFGYCTSLTSLNVGDWDMSNCSSFFNMFYNCKLLEDLDVSRWDTKNGINMQSVFNGCESLTSIDLTNWTTPRVRFMNGMFSNCYKLQEIIGLTNITTDDVTLLNSMFSKCAYLTELDLSSFNAISTTKLDYIFQGCTRLVNINSMKNICIDLSLEDCPNVSVESLMSIIDNLMEVKETRILKLGAVNLAKLTDSQIKVAVDKGWSVA